MGLGNHNGQVRDDAIYRNVWWALEGQNVAFGFGDLNQSDLDKILSYLTHPAHQAPMVVECWYENREVSLDYRTYPLIRISPIDGITYPYRTARIRTMSAIGGTE